jgi:KUP system potassium uptake protein
MYRVELKGRDGIPYGDNVFLSLVKKEEPFGVSTFLKEIITPELRLVETRYGYMELLDIDKKLKAVGTYERAIFYGVEYIYTDKLIWKLFSLLKRVTPNFVEFYRFTHGKLHGVAVRIEF